MNTGVSDSLQSQGVGNGRGVTPRKILIETNNNKKSSLLSSWELMLTPQSHCISLTNPLALNSHLSLAQVMHYTNWVLNVPCPVKCSCACWVSNSAHWSLLRKTQGRRELPSLQRFQIWFTPQYAQLLSVQPLKTKCCCACVLCLGYSVSLQCTIYFKIHQVWLEVGEKGERAIPGSSSSRGTFLKQSLRDKLCRMEFCQPALLLL